MCGTWGETGAERGCQASTHEHFRQRHFLLRCTAMKNSLGRKTRRFVVAVDHQLDCRSATLWDPLQSFCPLSASGGILGLASLHSSDEEHGKVVLFGQAVFIDSALVLFRLGHFLVGCLTSKIEKRFLINFLPFVIRAAKCARSGKCRCGVNWAEGW